MGNLAKVIFVLLVAVSFLVVAINVEACPKDKSTYRYMCKKCADKKRDRALIIKIKAVYNHSMVWSIKDEI